MAKSNYHGGVKLDHCYFCGAFGNLEEHHIIPQRFGGPDDSSNIVDLCSQCHDRIERLYDAQFYEHFGIEDETGKRDFHRTCLRNDCLENAQVKMIVPAVGEPSLYCTDHAMEVASAWARAGQKPLDVIGEQAVKIADGCPLKEAV